MMPKLMPQTRRPKIFCPQSTVRFDLEGRLAFSRTSLQSRHFGCLDPDVRQHDAKN
jgi:hypothetical protein